MSYLITKFLLSAAVLVIAVLAAIAFWPFVAAALAVLIAVVAVRRSALRRR